MRHHAREALPTPTFWSSRTDWGHRPDWWRVQMGPMVKPLMGSLVKKRRKRMRKKKHKKLLRRTRHQRRAQGK